LGYSYGSIPTKRFKFLVVLGLILWTVGLLSFPFLKDFTIIGGIPSTLLYLWCLQIAMWIVAIFGIISWLRGGS